MSIFHELVKQTCDHGASDLLIVADAPPTLFVAGRWRSLACGSLDARTIEQALYEILSEPERVRLEETGDLDLGLVLEGVGRIRVNVHRQRGSLAAAVRVIPSRVPPFESLHLPEHVLDFGHSPNGLVLITGPTGQGKSTTLASLVDRMNRTRSAHIVTIEDPIEFCFQHGTCIIEQRQIGVDSPSFASALRHVLRQRPDVILIGEMRDLETISAALTAAETGHLVLASLHTSGAAQTLARIIDVFPPAQQMHVRMQVAQSLRGIVSQVLVRDQLNDQLVPATEILVATSAIRRVIRDNETHLIEGMIETGRRHGMHTLEQSLAELVRAGRLTVEEAYQASGDLLKLEKLVGAGSHASTGTAHSVHQLAESSLSAAATGETRGTTGSPAWAEPEA